MLRQASPDGTPPMGYVPQAGPEDWASLQSHTKIFFSSLSGYKEAKIIRLHNLLKISCLS
jgi:hypothetical protein